MQKIKDFTDLIAYKKAHEFVLCVYRVTKIFPTEEKFGLVNQMRRCSVSITSNIAEGFGRATAKDKSQFYTISLGSLYELQSQLLIAKDLEYLSQEEYEKLHKDSIEVVKLVNGLIKSVISR